MNYDMKERQGMPAYLQLYHYIRKDIIDGVYAYGKKLPSKRTLAAETGVSVITVEHALNILCEEGYAESKQRSGYYVIYREADFQGSVSWTGGRETAVSVDSCGKNAGRENANNEDGSRENANNKDGSRENANNKDASGENVNNEDAGGENVDNRNAGRENANNEDAGGENANNEDGSRENANNKDGSRENANNKDASRENVNNEDAGGENVDNRNAGRENVKNKNAGRESAGDRDDKRQEVGEWTSIVSELSSEGSREEFPFSVLSRTMRRVLLDYGERILVKSPNCGCPELQNAICAYLARSRGIKVRPEQVVIGSGAEYLYGLIAQLLKEAGTFALEDPSYHKIRQVYQALGISCEMLPLEQDGIYSDALEQSGSRVLHVTPFHSFPSGVTASISKKNEYLRWAEMRQGVIIEDNFDSELTVSRKAEDPIFSMAKGEHVIYMNTFSKTVAPSLRVGYMILPPLLTKMFQEKLGFYSCTVPVFEQYVLAELLDSGDYERHVNRVRRARRRQVSIGV